MADVEFEDQWRPSVMPQKKPRMIRIAMKLSGGLITTQKQATVVLFLFAVCMFVLAYVLYPARSIPEASETENTTQPPVPIPDLENINQ